MSPGCFLSKQKARSRPRSLELIAVSDRSRVGAPRTPWGMPSGGTTFELNRDDPTRPSLQSGSRADGDLGASGCGRRVRRLCRRYRARHRVVLRVARVVWLVLVPRIRRHGRGGAWSGQRASRDLGHAAPGAIRSPVLATDLGHNRRRRVRLVRLLEHRPDLRANPRCLRGFHRHRRRFEHPVLNTAPNPPSVGSPNTE